MEAKNRNLQCTDDVPSNPLRICKGFATLKAKAAPVDARAVPHRSPKELGRGATSIQKQAACTLNVADSA
jgi:hypothetical protein